jgi:transcriptional regulator of acetoin/glycerol metabolism
LTNRPRRAVRRKASHRDRRQRADALSRDSLPNTEFRSETITPASPRDAERDHLRRTLQEIRWELDGPAGAAARLGLNRTTGERVTVADLPAEVAAASGGGPPTSEAPGPITMMGLDAVERDAIRAAILTYHGNLTQVARALRIAKSTLYLKIEKYALEHVLQTVRPSGRLADAASQPPLHPARMFQ